METPGIEFSFHFLIPDVMKDKNVLVYYRFAKSCTYCEKDYYKWERDFMGKMVTYRDLQKNQGGYVMHMNLYGLMELVYLRPENADFIYSSSEHFLEGEENEEERKVKGPRLKPRARQTAG